MSLARITRSSSACSAIAAVALAAAFLAPAAGAASTPSLSTAHALARAINLTSADLPGYKASPNPASSGDQQSDDTLATCDAGVPPSKQVLSVNSSLFTTGSALQEREVNSNVTVLESAALAQKDIGAIGSARGRNCLKTSLEGLVRQAQSGVTLSNARISSLPVSRSGNDGAFADRVTLTISTQGVHVPIFIDIFGVARGPAEVELETLGIGSAFPSSSETHLLALLTRRADAKISG